MGAVSKMWWPKPVILRVVDNSAQGLNVTPRRKITVLSVIISKTDAIIKNSTPGKLETLGADNDILLTPINFSKQNIRYKSFL